MRGNPRNAYVRCDRGCGRTVSLYWALPGVTAGTCDFCKAEDHQATEAAKTAKPCSVATCTGGCSKDDWDAGNRFCRTHLEEIQAAGELNLGHGWKAVAA